MNPPEKPTPDSPPSDQPTGCAGKALAIAGAFISVVWLLNFTAGLDGDNIPIVGNLDEALATAILIYCLSRLGVDTSWLTRGKSTSVTKKEE